MMEEKFLEYNRSKFKIIKSHQQMMERYRSIYECVRSSNTLEHKANGINKIIKTSRTNPVDSPFYVESPYFAIYLSNLDNFYRDNHSNLSKNVINVYMTYSKTMRMSTSLLSIRSVCKLLNTLKDSKEITKTNMRMVLSKSMLFVVNSRDFKYTDNIDATVLTKPESLQLGKFLLDGLIQSEVIQEDSERLHVRITEKAAEILALAHSANITHPSLIPFDRYKPDISYYYSSEDAYYQMVHLNDSTNTRESESYANDEAYEAINYAQKISFKINEEILSNHEIDLYDGFMSFCENSSNVTPSCFRFDSYKDLLDSCGASNERIIKIYKIEWEESKRLLDLYLSIIVLARVYSGINLYFLNYYDWRGRLYIKGYPLSPQGCSLSRSLLNFSDSTVPIGIDVTASGFQIMGLISDCKDTLSMTNLVDNPLQVDIYEENLKRFEDYIYNSQNMSLKIYKNLFDRKFYKNILMCLVYSETPFTRAIKIQNRISEKLGLYVRLKSVMIVANLILDLYKKYNPKLNEFYQDLTESVKKHFSNSLNLKDQHLKISANDMFMKCISIYAMQESKRISFRDYNECKFIKVSLMLNKYPIVNNLRKTLSGLVPNFIHNVDACILNKVILSCKNKNINIFTVHDCFYVDKKYLEVVKMFYFNACKDIVSKNPFVKFLNDNNINDPLLSKKYNIKNKNVLYFLNNSKHSNQILK